MINHSGQVPGFLQRAQQHLANQQGLEFAIYDIESCFPNMPRDAINVGLTDCVQQIKRCREVKGVVVPKHKPTKQCTWWNRPPRRTTRRGTHDAENEEHDDRNAYLSFDTMLAIMRFALDNCFIKMPNGQLLKQAKGIPMGDPLSPGMTIGACAWMEHE